MAFQSFIRREEGKAHLYDGTNVTETVGLLDGKNWNGDPIVFDRREGGVLIFTSTWSGEWIISPGQYIISAGGDTVYNLEAAAFDLQFKFGTYAVEE